MLITAGALAEGWIGALLGECDWLCAGIAGHAQFREHEHTHAAGSVEINRQPICGTGRAVADVTVAMGQRFEAGAHLLGKRMLLAIAGSVDPTGVTGKITSSRSVAADPTRFPTCNGRPSPGSGRRITP
jgi:hypothetical protein